MTRQEDNSTTTQNKHHQLIITAHSIKHFFVSKQELPGIPYYYFTASTKKANTLPVHLKSADTMATTVSASENRMMQDTTHHHPWSNASANATKSNRITTMAAEEFTSQKNWRTLPLRLERLVHILENWVSHRIGLCVCNLLFFIVCRRNMRSIFSSTDISLISLWCTKQTPKKN